MSKQKREQDDAQEQAMESEVHSALTKLGWLPPTTEAEVASAEATLREAPLPDSLTDPDAILGRPDKPIGTPDALKLPENPDIESMLRRAAREGGTIPPEIEDKMRRDRDQATKEMDDTTDGQDTC